MDMNQHIADRHAVDHQNHDGPSDWASTARHVVRGGRVETADRPIVYGSAWYHDAAIEQAERSSLEARCNPYEASVGR